MRYLSKKEKKGIQDKLPKGDIIYKDNNKYLIVEDDNYLPHLGSINEGVYKSVYVDKGAIPHILKGADLMRPGISKVDEDIEKNEIIQVKDENFNKTIALGHSLLSSKDLKIQEAGKSVKIFHFFKDEKY